MKLRQRMLLIVVLCGVAALGQAAFQWRLARAGSPQPASLPHPLAVLPLRLGPWQGVGRPITANGRHADAQLCRTYQHTETKQTLTVWLTYSREGAQGEHHPDVCHAVAGLAEDRTIPPLAPIDDGPPAQQYCFNESGEKHCIFSWHYTLTPPGSPPLDSLQQTWQRLRHPEATVTVDILAQSPTPDDLADTGEFLRRLDFAMSRLLGSGAARSSCRTPMTVIDRTPAITRSANPRDVSAVQQLSESQR